MEAQPTRRTRRQFLQALAAVPATVVLAACSRLFGSTTPATPTEASTTAPVATPVPAQAATQTAVPEATLPQPQLLAPTPACPDDDDPTPAQTAGPFYTPNSPERTSLLEPGMAGVRIHLIGYVLTTGCRPIAGALVDFWHADDNGVYDNTGYRLRGHQFTNEDGRYALETIVPGLYPGRTRHFHVRVQPPGGAILTTQLYFPNEPANTTDGIYRPELLIDATETVAGTEATFNFVLA